MMDDVERALSGDGDVADSQLPGAFTSLALAAWHHGRVVEATSLVRAALRRAHRHHQGEIELASQLALTSMLTSVGELDSAERAARPLRTIYDAPLAAAGALVHARLRLAKGDLAGAAMAADLAMAAGSGRWPFVGVQGGAIAALVKLYRNDVDGAHRELPADPGSSRGRAGLFGPWLPVWIAARVVEARDGIRAALDTAEDLLDDPTGRSRLLVEEPAAAAWLVRVALAAGDRAGAELVANVADDLADVNPEIASLRAAADHARGMLQQDPDLLARAIAGHTRPSARASAIEDAGVLLADRRCHQQATTHYAFALACYQAAGSEFDAARVRNRMQCSNGRRRRPSRPPFGWPSLTDAERRVASAVAEGLTNPQVAERLYLSRHTVDFHLRQIFRKLGVRSRVEMTRDLLLHSEP